MIKNTILKLSFGNISSQWQLIRESSYRVLVIPGHTKVEGVKKEARRIKNQQVKPRYKGMGDRGVGGTGEKDRWVDVWPTAKSFNYSVLPLPLRMGYIEGTENDRVIPSKYANAELMKIPNFLHLTPNHIRNHCQQLKKYCTAWPEGLKEDRMMLLTHFDYVRDAPSVKDERARFISVTVKLSDLKLAKDTKDKFVRLTSRFCVCHNDLLILTSGKCPTKQQNFDYIQFLLSVLYNESLKREEWEGGMELADMASYQWSINKSHKNVVQLLSLVQAKGGVVGEEDGGEKIADGVEIGEQDGVEKKEDDGVMSENGKDLKMKDGKKKVKRKDGGSKSGVGGLKVEDGSKSGDGGLKEGGVGSEVVRRYGMSVERLLNGEEDMAVIQQYKNSVQSLYSAILRK